MILGLLKQLPIALYRFVTYRLTRAFTSAPAAISLTETIPAASGPVLSDEFSHQVSWHANKAAEEEAAIEQNPLYQLWQGIPGGLKWSHYFSIYEKVFAGVQNRKLKVLEIGVLRGASLQLWRKYFNHPDTVIVGIDINPTSAHYADPDHSIHVLIGSQTDTAFLSELIARHGPFDIIIDDGSHMSSHIITTFNHLFLNGLKETGIYVVEDLHTNYFPEYRDSTTGFIDVANQLVELMHSHYLRVPDVGAYWKGFEGQRETIEVPLITTLLEEIRFFDSIIALYKSPQKTIPRIIVLEP